MNMNGIFQSNSTARIDPNLFFLDVIKTKAVRGLEKAGSALPFFQLNGQYHHIALNLQEQKTYLKLAPKSRDLTNYLFVCSCSSLRFDYDIMTNVMFSRTVRFTLEFSSQQKALQILLGGYLTPHYPGF